MGLLLGSGDDNSSGGLFVIIFQFPQISPLLQKNNHLFGYVVGKQKTNYRIKLGKHLEMSIFFIKMSCALEKSLICIYYSRECTGGSSVGENLLCQQRNKSQHP